MTEQELQEQLLSDISKGRKEKIYNASGEYYNDEKRNETNNQSPCAVSD